MRKVFCSFLLLMLTLGLSAESVAVDYPQYGPYEALTITKSVIQDVKYTDEMHIYILLDKEYKDYELTIRLSDKFKSAYRPWFNGKMDFVAPANRGLAEGMYSDWIETSANYIEYWVDGRLVLHLHKLQNLK